MTRWLLIVGLVLSGGVALANNDTGTKDTTGTQNLKEQQRSSKLDTTQNLEQTQTGEQSAIVPTGAKLIGTASAAEVREFPEMTKNKNVTSEDIVGARALDRVFETHKSYKQTVGYYDKMVKNGSAEQIERTTTKTATAWSLKMPDGKVQNVVVRNTQPTTIETVQALGVAGEEQLGGQGSMKNKATNPSMNQPSNPSMNQPSGTQPMNQPPSTGTNPNP